MLILTRKPGESLYIGDTIKVVVVEVKGNQVRLGIQADKSLRIYREEIYIQILEENRKAADVAQSSAEGLEGLSEAWRDRKGGAAPTGRSGLDALRIDQVTAGATGAGSESLKSPMVIKRRKKKSDE